MELTDLEKKALVNAKVYSHKAADGARKMLDSKYVESTLNAEEMTALVEMTKYITELEIKYEKMYDEYQPWKNN